MPDRGPTTAPLPETLLQSERSDSTYDGSFAGSGPFSAVSPRASFEPPERYQPEGLISSGSFGEIWRVRDRVLDRALAMKVLRVELVDSRHMRARFLGEARITADLQHPGIVAVHDQGELGDGRLWFTMKEVRGRTLGAVITEVHDATGPDGFREAPSGWTFRRLLDAFARVSQAVAFAHSRGVMHRDLKPDNIMVGEFGEVLVMDWGLARHVSSADDPVEVLSVDLPPELTRSGDILGTPAFMPPEQARGQRELHGPHSDVYALGTILFYLLSGRMPFVGSGPAVLRQVVSGPAPSLALALRDRPPVAAELTRICERAMEREIADRYPDADLLARDLVAFLEGARRREQALAVIDQARAIAPGITALRARAARCRREAEAVLAGVQPFDAIEKKRTGWDLEDEAARLGREAALRETEWLQTMHGALSIQSELPEAHALLADHYRDQLASAEQARRDEDAARFEALLRAHDDGRHAAFLRGEGALTLLTDPPGAIVYAERYELRDRRLVPVDCGVIGVTPLRAAPLLHGSYRLRVQAPGRAEVLHPVVIERGDHWEGAAPDEPEPHPIKLPLAGEIDPDECYVPAGYSWIGGDPEATDSLRSRRVWMDAFVIGRHPVTNQEYLEFLNDLIGAGREAEALSLCPRTPLGVAHTAESRPVWTRDEIGHFLLVDAVTGTAQHPAWPVLPVDWFGAMAFTRWKSAHTGRPYRLPNELERERAARGADGRRCPWGDHLDATFACVAESWPEDMQRVTVHDFPLDESPYGVRGLAGTSRDWCGNVWRHEGPVIEGNRLRLVDAAMDDPSYRAVRGGAWLSTRQFSRLAGRFAARPDALRMTTGFRLARSL